MLFVTKKCVCTSAEADAWEEVQGKIPAATNLAHTASNG